MRALIMEKRLSDIFTTAMGDELVDLPFDTVKLYAIIYDCI